MNRRYAMKAAMIKKMLPTLLLGGLAATGFAGNISVIPDPAGRTSFIRNEENAMLRLRVVNNKEIALREIYFTGTAAGQKIFGKAGAVPAKSEITVRLPLETRIARGRYPLSLRWESVAENGKKEEGAVKSEIAFGPVRHDGIMILTFGDNPVNSRVYQDIGMTHNSELLCWNYAHIVKNPQSFYEKKMESFNRRLADGYYSSVLFAPIPHYPSFQNGFPRYDRDGKVRSQKNMEASNPDAVKKILEIAELTAKLIADNPELDGIDVFSEDRDYSSPSFGKYEPAAFRKFAGFDIPPEVTDKNCRHYTLLKDFPAFRVIPEDMPLLVYYKWFWKEGDGWNPLYHAIIDGFKKHIGRPLWFIGSPAVRVPPLWGSSGGGEKLDYLQHWAYAYPDPIRIGAMISELQSMARECPGQKICASTQIIAYRSQTAPIDRNVKNPPLWVKDFPKAPYITLAPDLMGISLWVQISRQTHGMMFHGVNKSLVPDFKYPPDQGYHCTNLETKDVVKNMLNNVVKPLAPVLKRLPERKPEVAILESFASSIFAQRGSWGEMGWIFDSNLMLQWANLAPSVIYEEEILRDGFGGIKVLVMPHCDVLTEPVFQKIQEFQKKGGILVTDQYAVPGLLPDIMLREYLRTDAPEKDKKMLQDQGLAFRKELFPYYQPYVETSNPDLVTWVRSDKSADYLFVVNDKRTFGDYWGPYGRVMEKSLPNSGEVVLSRAITGAVYDPVSHKEVPFSLKNGKTVLKADMAREYGKLFLLLPEKIAGTELELPKTAGKGKTFTLTVKVKYVSGKTVESLHPVRVRILDSNGKDTDDSAFGALENGICTRKITIPLNAEPGEWTVTATDLASGKSTTGKFRVQ